VVIIVKEETVMVVNEYFRKHGNGLAVEVKKHKRNIDENRLIQLKRVAKRFSDGANGIHSGSLNRSTNFDIDENSIIVKKLTGSI